MTQGSDQRLIFPATERNRAAIGALLDTLLPDRGVVLELASGLRGMDGDTLREKIMRTLYAGMQVTPPTLDS